VSEGASFADALAALPARQQRFVLEYLRDLRGRDAALRAGYSAKTADVQASQLLRKLKPVIDLGLAEAMPPAEILYRLTLFARGTLADFLVVERQSYHPRQPVPAPTEDDPDAVRWVEDPVPVERVVTHWDFERARDAGALHLVKKFKEGLHGIELELHDPIRALELLGKAHKLFVDRQEQSGAVDIRVRYE
jgi:phage terminase small subunit